MDSFGHIPKSQVRLKSDKLQFVALTAIIDKLEFVGLCQRADSIPVKARPGKNSPTELTDRTHRQNPATFAAS